MLICCAFEEFAGSDSLERQKVLGTFFANRGHQIGYAVPRADYERYRQYMDDKHAIYRLPDGEEGQIERIAHLRHKHKHKVAFLDMRALTSTFSFHIKRLFDYSVIYDYGNTSLLYTNLLINPRLATGNITYQCNPEARLLMGPKFYICDTQAVGSVFQEQVQYILIILRDSEHIHKILTALNGLAINLQVHILCRESAPLRLQFRPFQENYENLEVNPVLKPDDQCFPYDRYPYIITEVNAHCLELARFGLFFINVATEKNQLEEAYTLSQMSASPTLGWLESKTPEELQPTLKAYLEDNSRRLGAAQRAVRLIDGQGLTRLAHFIPSEKEPKEECDESSKQI